MLFTFNPSAILLAPELLNSLNSLNSPLAHRRRRYEATSMNAPLGYALLRDRRVSLRPKCVALGVGLAVMGIIQLLQVPFESVLAFVLPGVGAAGDVAVDGVEAVVLPVLVATLLMPYLAPQNIVQELRAEHASRV
jgi:hypothetical protein